MAFKDNMAEYTDDLKIFIQVRLGSTRLPGKALKKFSTGRHVLDYVIENVLASRFVSKESLVVLTSTSITDDPIEKYCTQQGLNLFRGDEQDVLKRFCHALEQFPARYLIRVCADNPFLQSKYIDGLVEAYQIHPDMDYYSYKDNNGVPAILTHFGLFAELVSAGALLNANAKLPEGHPYREHVTPFIYRNSQQFSCEWLPMPEYLFHFPIRLTLDTPEDFQMVDKILKEAPSEHPDDRKIIKIIAQNPDIQHKMEAVILKNKKE